MVLQQALDRIRNHQFGFLMKEDIALIASEDRLRPILVRTGNGRFVTPAQNVAWFCDIIAKEGTDYVRDVSLAS